MHLIVSFSEVPEQGIQLELSDLSWFPDDLVVRNGDVSADLTLAKKGENKVEMQGKLQADIQLACDRCLSQYAYVVNAPIQLILESPDPSHHWRVHNLELSENDIETIELDEPVVDVGDILRQQLILAIPEKRICGASCLGLCNKCGANLNETSCDCEQEVTNSPFSILAQIKNNLENKG